MVPASGSWALVGQSASYLIKLAYLLWWALPSSQLRKLAAKANRTPTGMQYPDRMCTFCVLGLFLNSLGCPCEQAACGLLQELVENVIVFP
ncbi:hypothetical protein DSO57_1005290 [Entomophthora muscae]|uniref:Uncharacterized protein n=1 Tax=Entomophthora muscae TaxID=34485 RepID=A0ACC2TIX7_9FUNG|nr:hypothetical protein DSO57_1005290 [Entomophthora muscae]